MFGVHRQHVPPFFCIGLPQIVEKWQHLRLSCIEFARELFPWRFSSEFPLGGGGNQIKSQATWFDVIYFGFFVAFNRKRRFPSRLLVYRILVLFCGFVFRRRTMQVIVSSEWVVATSYLGSNQGLSLGLQVQVVSRQCFLRCHMLSVRGGGTFCSDIVFFWLTDTFLFICLRVCLEWGFLPKCPSRGPSGIMCLGEFPLKHLGYRVSGVLPCISTAVSYVVPHQCFSTSTCWKLRSARPKLSSIRFGNLLTDFHPGLHQRIWLH